MEMIETNQIEFDVFKMLHLVEGDSVLDDIFRDKKITLSYSVLHSMAKQDALTTDMNDRLIEIFNRIVLPNESVHSKYVKLGNTPIEDKKENLDTPKKSKNKLPKHYGKKRILQDINENNNKTELDMAMLALNDLRNVYSRLKNRGIKDKMLGTKKLSDADCRDIVATVRIVKNRLNNILKNK